MGAYLEAKIGEFLCWFWVWFIAISYWFVLLTGLGSLMIFFATKEKKFKTYTIAVFIIYMLLKAIDSSIN